MSWQFLCFCCLVGLVLNHKFYARIKFYILDHRGVQSIWSLLALKACKSEVTLQVRDRMSILPRFKKFSPEQSFFWVKKLCDVFCSQKVNCSDRGHVFTFVFFCLRFSQHLRTGSAQSLTSHAPWLSLAAVSSSGQSHSGVTLAFV